jgi:hypothetical protein
VGSGRLPSGNSDLAAASVANKVDVKFAQARLGHASAMTTLNIYSHEMTKHGHEYAAAIEAAFPFVSSLLAEGSVEGQSRRNVN